MVKAFIALLDIGRKLGIVRDAQRETKWSQAGHDSPMKRGEAPRNLRGFNILETNVYKGVTVKYVKYD